MKGQFPVIKDENLAHECKTTQGGTMSIRPPRYALEVTNPADSGDTPPQTIISAKGTTPNIVESDTTTVFVEGERLIPGPPGPTGPRGPAGSSQMPAPVDLVIVNSAVSVDASTPANTVVLAPIYYRLVLTEPNVLVRTPTGMLDSQRIIIEVIQDSVGGRTVTWDSGFHFGIDIASAVPTTTPNKRDFVAWVFSNGQWNCVGFTNGY